MDADDGVIDGSGLNGHSLFSGSGATGITFTFNQSTLGAFPTKAGIVWTDGGGTTTVHWGFGTHPSCTGGSYCATGGTCASQGSTGANCTADGDCCDVFLPASPKNADTTWSAIPIRTDFTGALYTPARRPDNCCADQACP